MQKKTIFFVGGALCLLALAVWGFYWYQKPRTSVENMKADYQLSATALYTAYQQNEKQADEHYTGKVIEVQGHIESIEKTDSTLSILLSADQPMGGVNCSMAKKEIEKQAALSKGVPVRIKGKCTGFLMDVNLVDAVLVHD